MPWKVKYIFFKSHRSCRVLGERVMLNFNGVFGIHTVLRIISDQFVRGEMHALG